MNQFGKEVEESLLYDRTKANVLRIIDVIGEDSSKIKDLVSLLYSDNKTTVERVSWVLSSYVHFYTKPLIPFRATFVDWVTGTKIHSYTGMLRNCLKVL